MSHTVTRHDGQQLRDTAAAAKDAVVELAAETGRFANQRVADAKESAQMIASQVGDKAGAYNDTIISFVRKNPYKSLAMAAGVGLAAGYLLRRK